MVHLPAGDRHRQSIQRIVRPSSRSEPVREPEEVLLVDGVEHHDACALDDLVFQSRDCQRPLSTIRLRYVRPARWMRPICSPMDSSVEILVSEPEGYFLVHGTYP